MKKLPFLLFVLLIVVGCSKDPGLSDITKINTEADPSSNLRPETRQIKGNLVTSIDPHPSNVMLGCSGDIPGFNIPSRLLLHGTVSHMGELIWQVSTLQHTSCNLNLTTRELTINVSGHLTASNGDRISYTGSDVIDVTNLLLSGPNSIGTISGTWTITGGTGRFDDASGSIDINGTVDFATLTASFTTTGEVTY